MNATFARTVEERTPYQSVHRLLMADGRIKWVEERGQTLYGGDGAPVRSIGTVQDITDRITREEMLHRSIAEKELLLREVHHP